jgi:endonuclease-3
LKVERKITLTLQHTEKLKLTAAVLKCLRQAHPDAGPRLHFSNPYQALVATILSAQTTDEQVNRVTPLFFKKYPDIKALADAEVSHVEEIIKSVGLFRNKAAHLVAAARIILDEHKGEIPDDFDSLLKLPGVGRKTANVVLFNAFGKPGLGVDTHVHRVANRIGLCSEKHPEGTEKRLKELIPEQEWGEAHHLLIFHGRRVCQARKPECTSCTLREICKNACKY